MYSIELNYPSEAWKWGMGIIQAKGSYVLTEDNVWTKEITNLLITVKVPQVGWPVEGSGWNMNGLNEYARQFLDFSKDTKGFDYRYGERMGGQVHEIIRQLVDNPNTRRATIHTWIPAVDLFGKKHKPCHVVGDFKFRGGRLNYTAIFRSHDFEKAYPANLYGMTQLLGYVADGANMREGSVTTLSISAHIYQ